MAEAHPGNAHPAIGGIKLCFGGNVFGWTLNRDQSFEILDAFYEAGGRMVDSAEGYSSWIPGNKGGESETIIGEWMELRGVRKDMLIATKTGMGGPPYALKPEKVAAAIEGSLERLRTDYVDIYYAHRDDKTTPLDEVISGYDDLVKAGKARELGASNYTAERLGAITKLADRMGMTPFTVLQPKFNLVWRHEFEGALQDLCIARGIAVLPYYGLASAFLSGKFRKPEDLEGTSRGGGAREFAENGGWAMLPVLDQIAAETGATPAQVALAWLRTQPAVAAPVASASRKEQLADLIGSARLELDAAQVERLTREFSPAV
ncbi:aldo/keto reductase [Novosphingobium sp. G106]|uniref:aldo/keto reductase n=1 Tax=Novosphingobium sp. G106 TaxID=2849500 RepID=UPI001C2CEB1D|nr:aldo/keto reductase [Novosphingobium sp. G106]MBV1687376.1 aldo/keto reductase [Novosphingobium sp. G106]